MTKKKTHEEFLEEMQRINPNILILGEYSGARTKIPVQCKICGYKWDSMPNGYLLAGYGCPKCAGNIKKTQEEFLSELKQVNPSIEVSGQYKNGKSKVSVKCGKCDYQWSAAAISLLRGAGCPRCAGNIRKSQNDFIEELHQSNPDIEVLGEYTNANSKVLVKCKLCNHQWNAAPHHLLRQRGCPNCCHASTSYTEQVILLVLQKLLPSPVLSRDRSTIGMELDIFLPKKKTAIEYGAWRWHKDKIEHDLEKIRLCESKGIKLIVIFDSCKAIPNEYKDLTNVWSYKEDFGDERNIKTLKDTIQRLCTTLGLQYNMPNQEFDLIRKQAYRNSRIRTTADFSEALSHINSTVSVLGEYRGNKNKILVHCKICDHEWPAVPSSLLYGHGCPKCGKRRMADKHRKPYETFVTELSLANPSVAVRGEYINAMKKISVECLKCGHLWQASPVSLLAGHGCPQCAGNMKKTQAAFLQDMEKVNPDVCVLGEYQATSKKILVECRNYHHQWEATPNMLLRGQGCPVCSGRTVQPGFNDLQTQHPEIARDWHPTNNGTLLPTQVSSGSRKKVWWLCSKGHEWETRVYLRTRGSGCPVCAGKLKKTNEEFQIALNAVNPNIIALEDYKNANTKIAVSCKSCQYTWNTTPGRLLYGNGCPRCAGNMRKSNEQFVNELSRVNPDVIAMEEYKGKGTKIQVKCKKCNYLWNVTPNSLLSSHSGCPKCSAQAQHQKRRKTHQQFVDEFGNANPRVHVKGIYSGAQVKLDVECAVCGHQWSAKPNNLLNGSGCPLCAITRRKK